MTGVDVLGGDNDTLADECPFFPRGTRNARSRRAQRIVCAERVRVEVARVLHTQQSTRIG